MQLRRLPISTTAHAYPADNEDCDGNCIAGVDCQGICGGTAAIDNCGICGGDDSTCTGCTDPAANNYDPEATLDDGSCELPLCLGDLNADLLVSVADILEMLGEFGCTENCETDLSGDEAVMWTTFLHSWPILAWGVLND